MFPKRLGEVTYYNLDVYIGDRVSWALIIP